MKHGEVNIGNISFVYCSIMLILK